MVRNYTSKLTSESAFKKSPLQVSVRPCTVAGEAKALADAVYQKRALESVQGRATALGDTALIPGKPIELEGLGTQARVEPRLTQ